MSKNCFLIDHQFFQIFTVDDSQSYHKIDFQSVIKVKSNQIIVQPKNMVQPIQQILQLKSLEQLKQYLEDRPNLNLSMILDKTKCTLLHHAAFKNDFQRLKVYIQHYKNFCQNTQGRGMRASADNFMGKLRAWTNKPNNQDCIPIHFAALHGNIEMIKFFEQIGSNIQYKTSDGENILFMCAQKNQLATFIYLSQQQKMLDLTQQTSKGDNLIHCVSREGYSDFLAYLLTLDIPYNHQNADGRTALMDATEQGNKQVVKRLLIKGANRHLRDNTGATAIQIAKQRYSQQLVKILNDQFTCMDKFKIACNKKMVYAPEKPSKTYLLFFFVLMNLIYLPTNVWAQIQIGQIQSIALQTIFYLLVLIDYFLLLRKAKKKIPQNPLTIKLPMCAQCRISYNKKSYHCHVCNRCIYRYDHHCPWINGCVGSHNIGKFAFLLFLLIIGLAFVIFSNVCLWGDYLPGVISYRDIGFAELNDMQKTIIHCVSLFFSLMIIPIILLFKEQLQNLVTNTTGFERRKTQAVSRSKSSLIASDAQSQSNVSMIEEEEEQEKSCSCFANFKTMITDEQ